MTMVEMNIDASSPWLIGLVTFAVVASVFLALWLLQVFTHDAGVVDYFWGPGFAVIGWTTLYLKGSPVSLPVILFMALVTLWAVRLAGQLILRHQTSHGEDARYLAMRVEGGSRWWLHSLYKVFLAQAVILWIMAAPVHAVALMGVNAAGPLFAAGLAIASIGIGIETIADWQLYSRKPADRKSTFRGGFWAISRHPNYFGEILAWSGFALAAFALTGAWWVFLGPVLLAATINGITLPLTEKHMLKSRSDYAAYAREVPRLVPALAGTNTNAGKFGGPAE